MCRGAKRRCPGEACRRLERRTERFNAAKEAFGRGEISARQYEVEKAMYQAALDSYYTSTASVNDLRERVGEISQKENPSEGEKKEREEAERCLDKWGNVRRASYYEYVTSFQDFGQYVDEFGGKLEINTDSMFRAVEGAHLHEVGYESAAGRFNGINETQNLILVKCNKDPDELLAYASEAAVIARKGLDEGHDVKDLPRDRFYDFRGRKISPYSARLEHREALKLYYGLSELQGRSDSIYAEGHVSALVNASAYSSHQARSPQGNTINDFNINPNDRKINLNTAPTLPVKYREEGYSYKPIYGRDGDFVATAGSCAYAGRGQVVVLKATGGDGSVKYVAFRKISTGYASMGSSNTYHKYEGDSYHQIIDTSGSASDYKVIGEFSSRKEACRSAYAEVKRLFPGRDSKLEKIRGSIVDYTVRRESAKRARRVKRIAKNMGSLSSIKVRPSYGSVTTKMFADTQAPILGETAGSSNPVIGR